MSQTGIFVTTCFIVLGIYDMIVVQRRGVGCSVSRFMQTIGFKSPIVSVVLGMLLGHFWMYMPPENEAAPVTMSAAEVEHEQHHSARSTEWPRVRAEFLTTHPACEACGGKKDLQVHHVTPFHNDPKLELDPTNFITLCTDGPCNLNCHFVWGHLGNTKCNNPNVREDAAFFRKRLEARQCD